MSRSRPPAVRGLGGGSRQGLHYPPLAPWFVFLAAAGGGLKAQAHTPPTCVPFCVRGRLGVAWAARSLLWGALCPVPCDVRVAAGGCAAGWPRAPLPATCTAGAVWHPRVPDAARGVSSWRVSPCRHVRPCTVRRWRPVLVPPAACPGLRATGRWQGRGDGPWL